MLHTATGLQQLSDAAKACSKHALYKSILPSSVLPSDLLLYRLGWHFLCFLKAHLHHYLHVDGMEQSTFSEAISSLGSLIEEYHQLDATKGRLMPDAPRLCIATWTSALTASLLSTVYVYSCEKSIWKHNFVYMLYKLYINTMELNNAIYAI